MNCEEKVAGETESSVIKPHQVIHSGKENYHTDRTAEPVRSGDTGKASTGFRTNFKKESRKHVCRPGIQEGFGGLSSKS